MPFDFQCPHCQQQFRPSADLVGKLTTCPHCSNQVRISAVDAQIPTEKQRADPRWMTPATIWHVQAEDGKQYGPVTGTQLHAWYDEGRITADCQLLRRGAGQWQWASDLYPDLEADAEAKPKGPKEAKSPRPKPAVREAPAQTAAPITPLSPDDFPMAGAGLKMLGPAIRPLPSGLGEPRHRSLEALANRRKFAPFMVANLNRPPLHKMLLVVALTNFVFGTLRGGLYFVLFLSCLLAVGALGQDADQQDVMRAAVSLIIALVMLVLNIAIVAGGIGLLQQKEWGRTATLFGSFVGIIIQLTGVCVTMLLGADGTGLERSIWILVLVALGPSIFYDMFAATTLSLRSVVADLEE